MLPEGGKEGNLKLKAIKGRLASRFKEKKEGKEEKLLVFEEGKAVDEEKMRPP